MLQYLKITKAPDCYFFIYLFIRFSFRINSSSGVISLAEALDHENLLSHLLIVRAEDRGAPQSRRTVVRVSINVTDINDNAPKFFDAQPDMLTVKNNLLCANVTATVSTYKSFPISTL